MIQWIKMKHCPTCKKTYIDESLNFCLDDGAWLADGAKSDEPVTKVLPSAGLSSESATILETARTPAGGTAETEILHTTSSAEYLVSKFQNHKKSVGVAVLALLLAVGGISFA
ncbi:MAG: hypothetical protein M3R15_29325, partial [Acidobacteriota bacterium]|nr:hypothetical protein [Acidobacteriota bacterium]